MTAATIARPARPARGVFPEGLTFVWLALGFILCRYLTDTILPDLGLRQLAHDYEELTNNVAPYLELPLCTALCVQVLRRSVPLGLLTTLGCVGLDYFFFVRFNEPLSWGSLALIGVAVAGSYASYRLGVGAARPRHGAAAHRRVLLICAVAYAIGLALALVAKRVLEDAALGGRLGEDLPRIAPVLPSLLALAAYVIADRRLGAPGRRA